LFPLNVLIRNTITGSLKPGKAYAGFCKAIDRYGEILTRYFPRSADDCNELPNKRVTDE
jgi:uncharacterized membrane protein